MKRVLAILILTVCAASVCAQAPTDVPTDHWAYEAINELIGRGYLVGYPNGTFAGDRRLTRYEFAVVIARILTDLSAKLNPAQSGSAVATPPATPDATPSPTLSPEDIANLRKLVDEFKIELTVIGTRLDKAEADLATLLGTVDTMNAILTEPEGAFETMKANVSKLRKVALSGYVQARYNIFAGPTDNPTGTAPNDSFTVRRARVKVVGKPTDRSEVVIQLDAGQNYTGSSAPSVSLKDAYVGYYFAGDPGRGPAAFMGQQKWPFGFEVVQSSSVRETPERSLVVQRFFPGERDRGLVVTQPLIFRSLLLKLGVFNGVQTGFADPNSYKDGVASLRFSVANVEGGASAYYGKGIANSAGGLYYGSRDVKSRWGVDLQYYLHNLSLKGEYIQGQGIDGGNQSAPFDPSFTTASHSGWWAQAAYTLARANQFVAKYETLSLDPLNPTLGRRSAWNLGYIRWLDEKNRFKLFYIVNEEQHMSFSNNVFISEWIVSF